MTGSSQQHCMNHMKQMLSREGSRFPTESRVEIEYDPSGSLVTTHTGQGTPTSIVNSRPPRCTHLHVVTSYLTDDTHTFTWCGVWQKARTWAWWEGSSASLPTMKSSLITAMKPRQQHPLLSSHTLFSRFVIVHIHSCL